MTSTKGLLLRAVGRFVLRETRVQAITTLAPSVRSIQLQGDALCGIAWTPGDKIQLLLPSVDVRTYTPATWDPSAGTTELVVFEHGDSPGARWSRALAIGDACRFFGPQRSIKRSGAVVLFGDETSYGLARALARSSSQRLACVFEVGSTAAAQLVVEALALPNVTLVERKPGDAHLADVTKALHRELATHRGSELVQTGRAQSIQRVRVQLRDFGIRDRGANKAYWAVGKVGLD